MATTVSLNGSNYSIPAFGDTGWAQGTGNLSSYLIALASTTLQPSGGNFTLTAPVNFGGSFGITALSFTGNLIGNVTGNITGNITGHAALDLPLTGGTLTGALGIPSSSFLTWNTAGSQIPGIGAVAATNGNMVIQTYGGTGAVEINPNSLTGTGGLAVFSGGVSPVLVGGISGSGAVTGSSFSGGNLTGNVTGNLTGNVTGNVSGNAGTVTTNANLTGGVTSVGNAATVVTNANLTGNVTSVGNATTIAVIPAVSGAALTGLTAANISAGTASISITGNSASVGGITVSGTPAAGQLLMASSSSAASWQEYKDIINAVGSSGTSLTVNWASGLVQTITLNNNCTISWSNAVAGQTLTLFLAQDATGSRLVTWPTTKWPSGSAPTLTTTASKTDVIAFFYDGTSYWGFTGGQNY